MVSDYAKGVVSATLMSELTRLAGLRGIPLVVDPKSNTSSHYKGATVITPNHLEATQAAGVHGDDDQANNEAGAIIRQRLGCRAVLITRGEKGMSLYEGEDSTWHIPQPSPTKSTMSLARRYRNRGLRPALSTGASIRDAATLANHAAAGVVVG